MLEIVYRKTDDLIPYINNARTHSDAQITQIAASIKEFGFANPVLVDGDNGIIAGHGRVMAAKKLGLDEVPTIELKHLTKTQKKAYILADNRLALNSDWDSDLLALELGELSDDGFDLDLLGFDVGELEGFDDDEIVKEHIEINEFKDDYEKKEIIIEINADDLIDIVNDIDLIIKKYSKAKIKINEQI
jgi:hypothetical protein